MLRKEKLMGKKRKNKNIYIMLGRIKNFSNNIGNVCIYLLKRVVGIYSEI